MHWGWTRTGTRRTEGCKGGGGTLMMYWYYYPPANLEGMTGTTVPHFTADLQCTVSAHLDGDSYAHSSKM
jgi:hypothetical protein